MMIRQPIKKSSSVALGLLSVVILCGCYTALSAYQHSKNEKDTTVPSWSQLGEGVKRAFTPHYRSGEVWIKNDALATGKRLILAVGISATAAILLGMLMGCVSTIEALILPPLSLLSKVPPTAILAVFFILVGSGLQMYVSMIAFGTIPPMAISIYLAVKQVPDELVFKAYTLGASHVEVAWNVIFRQILPKIIDFFRLIIGPTMVYLIAAEMIGADEGFGYRLRLQARLLDMSVVYPYLAMLAGFGYGVDCLLRRMQQWLCPWYIIQGR